LKLNNRIEPFNDDYDSAGNSPYRPKKDEIKGATIHKNADTMEKIRDLISNLDKAKSEKS
jgi:hypothetical protein